MPPAWLKASMRAVKPSVTPMAPLRSPWPPMRIGVPVAAELLPPAPDVELADVELELLLQAATASAEHASSAITARRPRGRAPR
jgi:hypothetical protein